MLQLVLAAPRSGSGKTTDACALLAAMQARGLAPCAFKSGPDYIDPMFHRAVLGVESHNLDLFFSKPETCAGNSTPGTRRATARRSSRGPWATMTAWAVWPTRLARGTWRIR